MSEDNKQEVVDETTKDEVVEKPEEKKAEKEVVFTEEQNAKMEEIINKRLSKALDKKTKEAEAEKAEAERLAKLTAEEKFEEEKKKFALERAQHSASRELHKEGLSDDFVPYVADLDNDKMLKNIADLKAKIQAEISKGVEGKLASSPKQVIDTNKNVQKTDKDALDKKLDKIMFNKY